MAMTADLAGKLVQAGQMPNIEAINQAFGGEREAPSAGHPVDPRTGRIIGREPGTLSANQRHARQRAAEGRPSRMWVSDAHGGGRFIEGADVDAYSDTAQSIKYGAPLPENYMASPEAVQAIRQNVAGGISVGREAGQELAQQERVRGMNALRNALGPAALPGMEDAQARRFAGVRGDLVGQERAYENTGIPTDMRGATGSASQAYLDSMALADQREALAQSQYEMEMNRMRQNLGATMDAVEAPSWNPFAQTGRPRFSQEDLQQRHQQNMARRFAAEDESLAMQRQRFAERGPEQNVLASPMPLGPEEQIRQQQLVDSQDAIRAYPAISGALLSGDIEAAREIKDGLTPGAQVAVDAMIADRIDMGSAEGAAYAGGGEALSAQQVGRAASMFAEGLVTEMGGQDFVDMLSVPDDGSWADGLSNETTEKFRPVILAKVRPELATAVQSMEDQYGRGYAISQLASALMSSFGNQDAAMRVATWIVDG